MQSLRAGCGGVSERCGQCHRPRCSRRDRPLRRRLSPPTRTRTRKRRRRRGEPMKPRMPSPPQTELRHGGSWARRASCAHGTWMAAWVSAPRCSSACDTCPRRSRYPSTKGVAQRRRRPGGAQPRGWRACARARKRRGRVRPCASRPGPSRRPAESGGWGR